MIIDCGTCVARHTTACDDCIVAAICDEDGVVELDREERSAIASMSDVGLIAPIRLIRVDGDRGHRASG